MYGSPMAGVLQYQALDAEGEGILDRLEEHWGAVKMEAGTREFYVPAVGTVDLDPNLDAVDPDWAEHVVRIITPR